MPTKPSARRCKLAHVDVFEWVGTLSERALIAGEVECPRCIHKLKTVGGVISHIRAKSGNEEAVLLANQIPARAPCTLGELEIVDWCKSLQACDFISGVKCIGCVKKFKTPNGLEDHIRRNTSNPQALHVMGKLRWQFVRAANLAKHTDIGDEFKYLRPARNANLTMQFCIQCQCDISRVNITMHSNSARHAESRPYTAGWYSIADGSNIRNRRGATSTFEARYAKRYGRDHPHQPAQSAPIEPVRPVPTEAIAASPPVSQAPHVTIRDTSGASIQTLSDVHVAVGPLL